MEVFGVAAAALQLGAQCLSALEVIAKIKASGKTLKSYQEQLESLDQISRKIAGNPLLHTKEILCHTEVILSVVKRKDLSYLLKKGRIHRTWVFILKERSLSVQSTTLEKLKATLILSIQEEQSRTLHEIHASVSNTSLTSLDTSRQLPHVDKVPALGLLGSTQPLKHGRSYQTPIFSNNTAGRNCNQTNGYLIHGATNDQLRSAIDFMNHHYENNTKEYSHGGLQVNGLRIGHSGGLTSQPQFFGGVWDGNKVINEPIPGREVQCHFEAGSMCEQVNGVHVTETRKRPA